MSKPYTHRPADLSKLKPVSILADLPADNHHQEETGGLFDHADPNRCIRCFRSLWAMPVALRTSQLKGCCFNCWSKISRNMGEYDASRRGAAGASTGLVNSAIKKENTLETGCKPGLKGAIIVHRRDVRIKRSFVHGRSRIRSGVISMTTRQAITELSEKALRRMVYTARNMSDVTHIVTLTYPADYPTDGKLVKYHLQKFRQWLTYKGIGGFWFLEFQERGAPHFHLFINGAIDHRVLRAYWYKCVNSGDIKHFAAGTQVQLMHEAHAAASYAAKYASKAEQKEVPAEYQNVGRFWGRFGGVKIEEKFQVNGDLGGGGKSDTDPLAIPVQERLLLHKQGRRVPVVVQTQLDLADALRIVSRIYADDRQRLIDQGKRVNPAKTGDGYRSFTAYDMAETVSRVLPRLGSLS